jgi:galactose mutarotase-like enzyme
MVGASLRHGGEELLGQRRGLAAYAERRATMGIPLLHPWANRLGERRFAVAGREVALDPDVLPLRIDPDTGLPIHGLLGAARGWEVARHEVDGDAAMLEARFDFAADERLLAAFPFPHELTYAATLRGATLEIATTVRATGDVAVPVSFGFHPYLRLPGVPRAEWEAEVPVAERLVLDERMLPTGGREPVAIEPGPLGARTFDDGDLAPAAGRPFALSGGGRRVELALGEGYGYAQVYAPADDDVVAFEPMTAPTNALVSGDGLRLVAPGERFRASFAITVVAA